MFILSVLLSMNCVFVLNLRSEALLCRPASSRTSTQGFVRVILVVSRLS